jgi:Protein of unknown function (DUF3043)
VNPIRTHEAPLFRRTDKAAGTSAGSTATTTDPTVKPGGKGRPTPTRKEAQAAARERAKTGMDKGTAKKVLRERRAEQNRRMREGMRSGDERFLPARDKGPVRRYIRDFIDSRMCFGELLLPLLVIIMVMQASGQGSLARISNGIWTATLLLTIVDTGWVILRLRRRLRERFPDEDLKGTTFYAVMRIMQLRFMRVPKRKVGLGGKPR